MRFAVTMDALCICNAAVCICDTRLQICIACTAPTEHTKKTAVSVWSVKCCIVYNAAFYILLRSCQSASSRLSGRHILSLSKRLFRLAVQDLPAGVHYLKAMAGLLHMVISVLRALLSAVIQLHHTVWHAVRLMAKALFHLCTKGAGDSF